MNLINIHLCNEDDWHRILDLRNLDSIRNNMYTDHIIKWDEHIEWIQRNKIDKNNLIFIVYSDHEPIGLASINEINFSHRFSNWAFYLSPMVQGKGIGAVLEFTILDYVFNNLKLEKLNCQVLSFNEPVIKMHEKFGFKKEGEVRSQILKDSGRVNVVHLGITREEWLSLRESKLYVLERYGQEIKIID